VRAGRVCRRPCGRRAQHAAGPLEGSKDLPSNKKLPLVLLCASGARAGRAAGLLRKAGYEKAMAVAGGNGAWRDASLPIEKKA
jgi:rhodanese-related sulfurtransferase